jgi:VCBS repeat-containing protein
MASIRISLIATATLLAGLVGWYGGLSCEEKGSWSFSREARDHPVLDFKQGEKVLFEVTVGRAYAIWLAYPGPKQKAVAEKTIKIMTDHRTWDMKGEVTNEHSFNPEGEELTYWYQWDMGLDRSKVDFDKIDDAFKEFLGTIANSKRIVISTDAGDLTLPTITVSGLLGKFGM